ncbi:hypothetical protein D7X12_41805, partial [Corallococcus sicarius]
MGRGERDAATPSEAPSPPAGRRTVSRELPAAAEAEQVARRASTPDEDGRFEEEDASELPSSGSAVRGAPARNPPSARRTSADAPEAETVSATGPGPAPAPRRKRLSWAIAAALGLAGVAGVWTLSRSNPGAPGLGQGSTASPPVAKAPAEPATREAVEAEIEGQRREAALALPPVPT